jgi:acetyltransferase-like isoleucine patch superfamily enzyme
MIKAIIDIIKGVGLLFLIYLPGPGGVRLRRFFYSKKFRKCGENLWIGTNVHISGFSMIEIGDNVKIRENAIIQTSSPKETSEDKREVILATNYDDHERGKIIIGDHSRIAFGAILLGYGGIKIGDKCGIGPYAKVYSETFHHKGKDLNVVYKYSEGASQEEQCVLQGFIQFCDGAGVASGVLVLPGATIGKDSWVSPNSVVRIKGRIEDNIIAAGNPASITIRRPCNK